MSKIERIEFYTMPFCASCDLALHDVILPVAKEKGIPVHVLPAKDMPKLATTNGETVIASLPFACVIKKVNGVEKKQCIRGYDSNYSKDLTKILEED